MLNYRNSLRSGHILTLEDPIEFLFKNMKSIVNQREIGTDAVLSTRVRCRTVAPRRLSAAYWPFG